MVDLVEKFFKEDLAEVEKKALGEALLSSEETAQRFGEKAEEAYRRFGLPEPQWNGPDTLRPTGKYGLGKWLLFGVLLAAVGGSTWRYLAQNNPTDEITAPTVTSHQPSLVKAKRVSKPLKPAAQKPIPVEKQTLTLAQALPVSKPKTSAEAPLSTFPSLPANASSNTIPLPSLFGPKSTPVNLDQNPNRPFSSLSVVLRRSTPGFLVVRVLDAHGAELVPLYSGNLPAGSWAFEWNGLLRDGRLAPPGRYRIEVRAGSWAQTKEVLIQK